MTHFVSFMPDFQRYVSIILYMTQSRYF